MPEYFHSDFFISFNILTSFKRASQYSHSSKRTNTNPWRPSADPGRVRVSSSRTKGEQHWHQNVPSPQQRWRGVRAWPLSPPGTQPSRGRGGGRCGTGCGACCGSALSPARLRIGRWAVALCFQVTYSFLFDLYLVSACFFCMHFPSLKC